MSRLKIIRVWRAVDDPILSSYTVLIVLAPALLPSIPAFCLLVHAFHNGDGNSSGVDSACKHRGSAAIAGGILGPTAWFVRLLQPLRSMRLTFSHPSGIGCSTASQSVLFILLYCSVLYLYLRLSLYFPLPSLILFGFLHDLYFRQGYIFRLYVLIYIYLQGFRTPLRGRLHMTMRRCLSVLFHCINEELKTLAYSRRETESRSSLSNPFWSS